MFQSLCPTDKLVSFIMRLQLVFLINYLELKIDCVLPFADVIVVHRTSAKLFIDRPYTLP